MEISIDEKIFSYMKLIQYKGQPEKIKEDEDILYDITRMYLKAFGANPEFLDKPGVVERVKDILFKNLLLDSRTRITAQGIQQNIPEESTIQKFSVLENGDIGFYKGEPTGNTGVLFGIIDNEICVRYVLFDPENNIEYENRVVLDKYGMDSRKEVPTDENHYRYRQTFQPIIFDSFCGGYSRDVEIYEDVGNYTIDPRLDEQYLLKGVRFYDKDETFLKSYSVKASEPYVSAFVGNHFIVGSTTQKVKANYEYLTKRYPQCIQWFIDRYGRDNLEDYEIDLSDVEAEETPYSEKILKSIPDELQIEIPGTDMSQEDMVKYLNLLVENDRLDSAIVFYTYLPDEEKIKALEQYSYRLESKTISDWIKLIESDEEKIRTYRKYEDELSIVDKVYVIISVGDENEEYELVKENIEEIIDWDNAYREEKENEMAEGVFKDELENLSSNIIKTFCEPRIVMDLYRQLSEFAPIYFDSIRFFSEEEISELLDIYEDDISAEDFCNVARTGKLDDEVILDYLTTNWEEDENISEREDCFEVNDKYCKYGTFLLSKVSDSDSKCKFIDEHREYFEEEDLCFVLESFDDNEEMIRKAKQYNLGEFYFNRVMSVCDNDDIKIRYLQKNQQLNYEEFYMIAGSVQDVWKAFQTTIQSQNPNLTIFDKLSVVNGLIIEDYDIEIYDKKFEFLMENKDLINKAKKSDTDKKALYLFVSSFWEDDEKLNQIQEAFGDEILEYNGEEGYEDEWVEGY